ncbi:P-loop containing nucleoside triphosphate hydrolase protein [Daedaleopsis nitida]|nr:P-loop containing nucleoside triphosphate hydrolase protein [Daedaleopsis nitida]
MKPTTEMNTHQVVDGLPGSTATNDAFSELLTTTTYAKSSKELIDFVAQLRSHGAHIDLELPRIVVIGNQSAGKSSLVEAISGINVPRDPGTCTRCPMECRLSHSNQWSCQVKIRWEYSNGSKRRLEVEEVDFGPRLFDKADVELMLRRAQAAVLNPDTPLHHFLAKDDKAIRLPVFGHQLQFSRNVVCVELVGPDLADLSFVDLPGIVQNADEEIVRLVEDLVHSYISGDNSLLLVTLPMSDDIENQKAARLAKRVDPAGSRTIGVLTKPDTLTAGSTKTRDLWLEVLEGRRHPLLHGYYCTRQPDEDERRLPRLDARAAEASFFAKTAPWSTSVVPGRFGTWNLVQNISALLTQIIRNSLPKILNDVSGLLSACNKQLQALPPPVTSDPAAYVLNMVTKFCSEIEAQVQGSPESATLVQKNRETYEAFKFSIRGTAPPFVPFDSSQSAPTDLSGYIGMGSGRQAPVFLRDMRKHIRSCVTRELPNNVPYAAKRFLIRKFQQGWEEKAMVSFEQVQQTFKTALSEITRTYFARYSNLSNVIYPIISEQLDEHTAETVRAIRIILKFEAASPFTQNTHYLAEKRSKHLAHYKDARAASLAPSTGQSSADLAFPPTDNPFAKFVPPVPSSSLGTGNNNAQSEAWSKLTAPSQSTATSVPLNTTASPAVQGTSTSIFASVPQTSGNSATQTSPTQPAAAPAKNSSASTLGAQAVRTGPQSANPQTTNATASPKPSGFFSSAQPSPAPAFVPTNAKVTNPLFAGAGATQSPYATSRTPSPFAFFGATAAQPASAFATSQASLQGFASTATPTLTPPVSNSSQPNLSKFSAFAPQSQAQLQTTATQLSAFATQPAFPSTPVPTSTTSAPTRSGSASAPTAASSSIPAPAPAPTSSGNSSASVSAARDPTAVRDALAALAKIGLFVTEDDLGKLQPADTYEEELELMAEVRAYFDVAYKRVIDYVPLAIDESYLYTFARTLQEVLYEKLGLGSAHANARCSAYIAESPQVAAAREELTTKKRRLENVHKALLNFGL